MRIALIGLAAGRSSRTGALGRKPLLPWPTRPGSLLGVVLENYKKAHSWHDAVVVHRGDTPVYEQIIQDAGEPYRSLINPSETAQMSDSLRLGLRALAVNSDATMIALGDMPFVDIHTLQTLLKAAVPGKICRPTVNGKPANPVIFPKQQYPALQSNQGDKGGRDIIKQNPDRVISINFSDPSIFQDIDTPEDYSKAIKQVSHRVNDGAQGGT